MGEDLKLPPADYAAWQTEIDAKDAANAELTKRGESASIETRILMLHTDWTPAEVEAEKQLILDQSGANVPDPLALPLRGGVGPDGMPVDRTQPPMGPDGQPITQPQGAPIDKTAAENASGGGD